MMIVLFVQDMNSAKKKMRNIRRENNTMTKEKTCFTKLDFANCLKYTAVANNVTLKTAFANLERENTRENHKLICQQIIGYLRCMCDLKIIDNNTFNDCVGDLHYMKSVLKG